MQRQDQNPPTENQDLSPKLSVRELAKRNQEAQKNARTTTTKAPLPREQSKESPVSPRAVGNAGEKFAEMQRQAKKAAQEQEAAQKNLPNSGTSLSERFKQLQKSQKPKITIDVNKFNLGNFEDVARLIDLFNSTSEEQEENQKEIYAILLYNVPVRDISDIDKYFDYYVKQLQKIQDPEQRKKFHQCVNSWAEKEKLQKLDIDNASQLTLEKHIYFLDLLAGDEKKEDEKLTERFKKIILTGKFPAEFYYSNEIETFNGLIDRQLSSILSGIMEQNENINLDSLLELRKFYGLPREGKEKILLELTNKEIDRFIEKIITEITDCPENIGKYFAKEDQKDILKAILFNINGTRCSIIDPLVKYVKEHKPGLVPKVIELAGILFTPDELNALKPYRPSLNKLLAEHSISAALAEEVSLEEKIKWLEKNSDIALIIDFYKERNHSLENACQLFNEALKGDNKENLLEKLGSLSANSPIWEALFYQQGENLNGFLNGFKAWLSSYTNQMHRFFDEQESFKSRFFSKLVFLLAKEDFKIPEKIDRSGVMFTALSAFLKENMKSKVEGKETVIDFANEHTSERIFNALFNLSKNNDEETNQEIKSCLTFLCDFMAAEAGQSPAYTSLEARGERGKADAKNLTAAVNILLYAVQLKPESELEKKIQYSLLHADYIRSKKKTDGQSVRRLGLLPPPPASIPQPPPGSPRPGGL